MLTHGLEKFKEYFIGFENQYVLIGGTACSNNVRLMKNNA